MEDSELEEGEACDYLDPDAFSYIDEKIQNVLGHFQQEFVDGEISAENLGAKWGGYGSFLPAYKRSPSLLTQPKSPLRAPNPRDSKSTFESKNQNRNVLPNSSISKNTLPSRPPPADNNNNNNKNNVTKKETRLPASGPSSRPTPIQKTNNNNINNNNAITTNTTTNNNSNSNNNSSKPSIDQKTLKVRIKVGSDNNLRRNNNNNDNNNNKNKNAALYNNLGLDISPSTSYDASTGGSAGPSPVSKVVPGESPQSILQTMTSVWTPGGFVLSPLRACFVNFTGKVTPLIKNTPMSQNDADLDFMVRECKGSKSRSGKHDKKKHISVGTKSLKDELPILPLEQPYLDKESRFKGEKSTNESVKEERFESFQNFENSDLKGKGKLKSIKGEKQENLRDSSERKSRSESKKKLSVSKTDSEESTKIGGTGIGTATGSTMKNLKVEENLVEPKIQAPHFEDKRVKKEKQIINTPSIDSKERKKEKDYISRSKKMENVPKLDKEKEIYNQLFEDFGEDNNIAKDLSETKKKPIGIKIEKEREIIPKERPSYNKLEKDPINEANMNNSTLVPVNNNSTNLPVPVLPLVPTVPTEIKEDWVGCDKCCKWRLLPYWTKPESLPKKWHCKLLDWLPGKNRCDVSEEETTAGANALNLVPIPIPNAATSVAIPVAGQTGHPDPILNNQILKKKDKVPDLVVKKKDKGKVGLKEPASYSSGGLGLESKSAEFITDAKKLNHQSSGRYSDGGDMMEKQSKSRNKRPVDPDDSKAYKKPKKEENLHTQIKEKPTMSKPIFNEKVESRGVKFEKKENFSNVPELERYEKSEDRIKKPGGTKGPNSNKLEELGSSGKRDGNFGHPSVEATSSSSKVSGSRRSRSRSKLHEKRGSSPIDSVSSSPVRHSNSERLNRKMKGVKDEDLTINIASYTLPFVSPKRNTGGGSNEIERPNKLPRFSESHRAEGGSSKNAPLEQDNRFSSGSAGLDKSGNKDGRRLGKSEIKISSRPPKEKERIHNNPEKGGSEKRQQVVEKRELETPVIRENRMQGNGYASRSIPVPPQPRKVEIGGVQTSVARQATPNGLETSSPAKRDHSAVYALLKEARALKHTADRLKNDESELEGTGLYFEAALKFLQAASLCEPVGNDTSRQGDSTQAMQIYSETAKLCEFCAHAYERCKKMGAASLAYKCVEVAYLKAAFYKYPSASRDRHELQTTLQILQTGESPSSSASDIDNLNKVNKDSNSPQVAAGNHLLVSRNHAHMMRLLAYTNDLNCAFEATRKSQTAFAAASSNPENGENGENGLTSVRRALDFGFHNVRELLQLIRVSMDSVC